MTAPNNSEPSPNPSEESKAFHAEVIGLWIVDGDEEYRITESAEGGLIAYDEGGKPISAAWVIMNGRKVYR